MVEVESLDSLVAYQRGSVVSRTLIDKKPGTVTLFAFDEGEVIIMPANEPHALRALTPFKMMLVMIRS